MHHKNGITNIHIKPTSCIDPKHHQKCIQTFPWHSKLDMFWKIYQRRRKVFNWNVCWEWPQKATFEKLIIKYNNKKNNKNNHKNNTENRDYKNLKKLPWIPKISLKIKRDFKKIGKDIAFTSGKNLQQIPLSKKQTQTTIK